MENDLTPRRGTLLPLALSCVQVILKGFILGGPFSDMRSICYGLEHLSGLRLSESGR
jgi:hypothetical protein